MAADLETRVKELEAKVQELNDREAVRDLRYRYHEYVNEGKFNDIPNLFTDDGELDFAHLGKGKGREGLLKFFGALNEKPSEANKNQPRITWVKQFIHNHTWFICTATLATALRTSKPNQSSKARPISSRRAMTTIDEYT